eukprot:2790573-Pyramimonas_sp.AAC.1
MLLRRLFEASEGLLRGLLEASNTGPLQSLTSSRLLRSLEQVSSKLPGDLSNASKSLLTGCLWGLLEAYEKPLASA